MTVETEKNLLLLMITRVLRRQRTSPFPKTMAVLSLGLGVLSMLNRRRGYAGRSRTRAGSSLGSLALVGAGLAASLGRRSFPMVSAALAGLTILNQIRRSRGNSGQVGDGAIHLRETVTIDRPAEELYRFWRNFENLPRFMAHLHEVQPVGENQWRWVVSGPLGSRLEWTAEIMNETPDQLIAWRSLGGGDVESAGTVRFEPAPAGRGTIVKVEMQYRPPAGKVGATIARLLGVGPEKQVGVDLHRFKQLMEAGEVSRTEGQSAGRSSSTSPTYDDIIRG
jgi:uncharacterized membrane protein